MKPVWLIEQGVWKDDNVNRMIEIIRSLGLTVHAEQFTPLGGMVAAMNRRAAV
jgi:hypothetical protein